VYRVSRARHFLGRSLDLVASSSLNSIMVTSYTRRRKVKLNNRRMRVSVSLGKNHVIFRSPYGRWRCCLFGIYRSCRTVIPACLLFELRLSPVICLPARAPTARIAHLCLSQGYLTSLWVYFCVENWHLIASKERRIDGAAFPFWRGSSRCQSRSPVGELGSCLCPCSI